MSVRTVRATRALVDGGRSDVLVHALAQLPDTVRLQLPAAAGEADRLRELASAYGIADRLETGEGSAEADLLVAPGEGAERREDSLGICDLSWHVSGDLVEGGAVRTIAELIAALGGPGDDPAGLPPAGPDLADERVAVITNFPTHYRVPLWNRLARELERVGCELAVFSSQPQADPRRPWLRHAGIEFEHRPVNDSALGRAGRGLTRALRSWKPTLVVSGGFDPRVTGRALRYASSQRIPFGLWSGDTALMGTGGSRLRRIERRWIARRSSFGLAYGWLAAEYVRSLAPGLPQVIARNTASVLPDRERDARTRVPGDADRTLEVLTVGQAIPRKRLDVAVDAFAALDELSCRLTVAGGGRELAALAERAGDTERIRFLGPVGSDRILECYRDADIFLFPSEADVFGLVLVEAMGSGLATITSSSPASVADLCVDGRNSVVLRTHDPTAWAGAIERLVRDEAWRRDLAADAARTIRARWTLTHSVEAWIAGLRLGVEQRRLSSARR